MMNKNGMSITDYLPQAELLAMAAEEAAELSQALLKLRRVLKPDNPARTDYPTAIKAVNEEIADLRLALDQLKGLDEDAIHAIYMQKLARWLSSLMERDGRE